MNIEIANRLVKLRKEKGMSQEELADALGISRQAVSKWERAEASPDTDNLICLAKLYNLSLDSLLDTEQTAEEIVVEQKEKTEESKRNVEIGASGIHIVDDDGSQVHINGKHIVAFDANGKRVNRRNHFTVSYWLNGLLMLVAAVGYLLMGSLLGQWGTAWILFLLPEIISSVVRCFEKKDLRKFNIALLATYVFFLVSMIHPGGLWHPMWVVFLIVPIYHSLLSPFYRHTTVEVHD